MTEDDTVVISSNGQLTLTSVSTDHEGEWKCQATNSSGSNDANTQLTVIPIKGSTCAQACMHTCIHAQTNTYIMCYIKICYPGKSMPSARPSHKHKPIIVSEFGTHVTILHENNNQGFKAEYDVRQLKFVLLNIINVLSNYAVFLQWRGHVYCYRCCCS